MKVLVSAPLPGGAVAALARDHIVIVAPVETGLGREGILEFSEVHRDAAALVTLLSDRIDDAVLVAFPALQVVANVAVGVNNIDLGAARRRSIAVCNTPDVLTEPTADLTMALILAVARRVVEGDALTRSGTWAGWAPTQLLGRSVAGSTLGIVGLGRIGRAVAQRAQGFGMRVLAAQHRSALPLDHVEVVPLDLLLASSDFISLHCPLTTQTRHMIDAEALTCMKPSAILINTSRGAVVDESALAEALRARRIGGAGLDVYSDEPMIPEQLRDAPNTVLLPHIGSATSTAREAMARLACEGVAAVLAGNDPPNRVA